MDGATGVVWDFGNVLVDWRPDEAIAAGVGEDEAARFLAAEDFDFFAFNHGPDSGALTWAEALAEVRRSHPHWAEHVAAYHRHFRQSILEPVPGTPDLLRALHEAGVPQWGLTNWSHELYPHAPALHDFLGLLDGVVVSGTERLAKPDPAIYRLIGERTGVPLERWVFVDDRTHNVEAARRLGMEAVLFSGADSLRRDLVSLGLPL